MKIKKLICFVALICFANISYGAITVRLSSDSSDPLASNFTFQAGSSNSLYVHMASESGLTVRGASFDVVSSDPAILEATDHIINNPGGRWVDSAIQAGNLGDLVIDTRAAGITGINTGAEDEFTLFSEIQFDATEVGTTDVTFAIGPLGFSDGSNTVAPSDITFVGATVTAVPEPSGLVCLGLASLAGVVYRRRRQ